MSKTIFIAEDDTIVLDVYRQVFGNNGYDVIVALDGDEAVKTLDGISLPPTLILLDIMMPKVSGFEVLKFIKSKDALREVPVMFVTNLSAPEHVRKGLSMGADKFLIKSEYTPEQIVSVIAELLTEKGKV